MKVEVRIIKNIIVMILQPFLLNLISLFVIGYVARKFGVEDFGIFNLAILFSTFFYPLGLMGLNNVGIRDISKIREDREESENYIGRLLPLRLFIFSITVLIIITANLLMNYPPRVTAAIHIASVLVGIQLFSEAVCDVFTAYERMEYTALISLISGLTLMSLSIAVLYLGYGLYEVLGVYVIGQLIGLIAAISILKRKFLRIKIKIDFLFWKEKFIEGLPFITMSLIWAGIIRLDTIVLSKIISPGELGIYTTGMLLATKTDVIPGAVGNSIFPAVANLFATGRHEEIKNVTQRTFSLMAAIALPICIGTTLYGNQIVKLVFGINYEGAGWILSIAIWSLLLRCFMSVEFSILTAMHKQKKTLRAYVIVGILCLALNFIFTYSFKIPGALVAFMGSQIILVTLFTIPTLKELPGCLQIMQKDRILYLNIGLILLLVLVKPLNFPSILILSGIFYFVGAFALRIITIGQIRKLKEI